VETGTTAAGALFEQLHGGIGFRSSLSIVLREWQTLDWEEPFAL